MHLVHADLVERLALWNRLLDRVVVVVRTVRMTSFLGVIIVAVDGFNLLLLVLVFRTVLNTGGYKTHTFVPPAYKRWIVSCSDGDGDVVAAAAVAAAAFVASCRWNAEWCNNNTTC